MHTNKSYSYRKLLPLFCLLFSVSLLFGCAKSFTPVPTDSQPVTERSDSADAKELQQHFDALCQEFFQQQASESFLTLHYTLKNPEQFGITDYDISFGEFSLEHMKQSAKQQDSFQEALAQIDPSFLTQDQELTYRILTKALQYEDSAADLELYYQPLTPSTGVHAQLPILLTEYTFYDKEDIENYLILLSDMDRYFSQILDFEKQKAEAGLFMTESCLNQIISDCDAYLLASDHNLMVTEFNARIDALTSLSEEEKANYKERNQTIVSEHFIPAYELLINGLKPLKGYCIDEHGLYSLPEGKNYYEYLVHSAIGPTAANMDELKEALEDQIDADLLAISDLLKDHPEVSQELQHYRFSKQEPLQILSFLEDSVKEDFPEISQYSYVTKYVPKELEPSLSPAFFLVPPIDSYQNCVIYINQGSSSASDSLFPTLAHEGIPGHLYQNVYFLSNCDAPIRTILSFPGYQEGWASYVENYSYTIPGNGLSEALGQVLAHNSSASLGIHALLDLNINYYGWNQEQTSEFLTRYFDISQEDVVESLYQAVINNPSNYLTYYAGYLEIMQMQSLAKEQLKTEFQLLDFHQFLLDIGPAPFTVIEPYFHTWLMTERHL